MALPIFQTNIRELSMMETQWASQLNPLIIAPLSNGQILSGIKITSGINTISHRLSRNLQGWFIVGINAAATIYDQQAFNTMPDKTLILNSSAPCTINLFVF